MVRPRNIVVVLISCVYNGRCRHGKPGHDGLTATANDAGKRIAASVMAVTRLLGDPLIVKAFQGTGPFSRSWRSKQLCYLGEV